MIIEYNERLRWLPQDHSVAIPNLNLLWVNPIPSPGESIFMRMTFLLNTFHSEDSTQAMVHECSTDGGIDPSDIDNVMSAFKANSGKSPQQFSRKIKVHKRSVFARTTSDTCQNSTHLSRLNMQRLPFLYLS